MKVASKVIFLISDADGFAAAISGALHPNPNCSAALRRLESSFELSLDRYGITDRKASGDICHFVDGNGIYQVSVLLLKYYEPPILVCAVNEVLASITGEESSTMPTVVIPFIVAASKLKSEAKTSTAKTNKVNLYGIQIGPESSITGSIVSRTQRPPLSLQIHYEPLACILHLARVLKLSTFVLIGQRGQHLSKETSVKELEVVVEMGELLATLSCLCFVRDKILWTPTETSRDVEQPWRALYGNPFFHCQHQQLPATAKLISAAHHFKTIQI